MFRRRIMEAINLRREVLVSDEEDPVIKMTDPFLEVSVPDDEHTIFQAIRFGDTDMIFRQLREGYDINYKSPGTVYLNCSNVYNLYLYIIII